MKTYTYATPPALPNPLPNKTLLPPTWLPPPPARFTKIKRDAVSIDLQRQSNTHTMANEAPINLATSYQFT